MNKYYNNMTIKNRDISVPTYETRVYENIIKNILDSITDKDMPIAFIKDYIYINLSNPKINYVIKADIKNFYNSINTKILNEKVKSKLTKAKNKNTNDILNFINYIYLTDNGIPTGSVISPSLSKIYLEKTLLKLKNLKINFVRYYDDFLIFCESYEEALKNLSIFNKLLHNIRLNINESKTIIKSKYETISFIGMDFCFNTKLGKPIFSVKKSISRKYEKKFIKYCENAKDYFFKNNEIKVKRYIDKINTLSLIIHSQYKNIDRFNQNFKFINRLILELGDYIGLFEEDFIDFKRIKKVPVLTNGSLYIVKLNKSI